MKHARHSLILIVWISLAGCASSKDAILPADGPTMKAIYTRHFSDIGMHNELDARHRLQSREIQDDAGDLAGYVRDAFNELDVHFPRLPNPTLVLYVFPHLAGNGRVPVPGYATTFSLYERVEYALPGEVPGKTRPSAGTTSE